MITLTEQDARRISEQCIHQGAITPIQVARFALAYADALRFAGYFVWPYDEWDERIQPHHFEELILRWAELIDPVNAHGYRQSPVSFRDGTIALHHDLIERAMENLCTMLVAKPPPDQVFKMFQEIHPFRDGNGRVGHLLWAVATAIKTGVWPTTLPPDLFGRKEAE